MDKNGQPITDDAELAKVLEGMQDTAAVATAPPATGLSFEEAQVPPAPTPATDPDAPTAPAPPAVPSDALPPIDTPVVTPGDPALTIPTVSAPSVPAMADPGLESIKKDALEQLRPLVDKLDLEPDEKFDTLLLIIRSTDDKSLVSQAYESAKLISDDAKRATALLDIVKEIDYFSHPGSQQPQI